MNQDERIILEGRLTRIEDIANAMSKTLDILVQKFTGHTHPEIEKDYTQTRRDLNELGQKLHRVELDTAEKVREMDIKIHAQENINIKQEMYFDNMKSVATWILGILSVVVASSIVGFGVFLFKIYSKLG